MTKKTTILLILCLIVSAHSLLGQSAFMAAKGIAVFEPPHFDPGKTLPSLALRRTLKRTAGLPGNWELFPHFSTDGSKTVADIRYEGDADLYGTGEAAGSLRRNGTTVTIWNTDNYGYRKEDGRQLYQAHPWVMGVRKNGTAFGIIADNTWRQTFQLDNPIHIVSDGPAFRIIIIEAVSPAALLNKLGWLTGTIELPPLWALGYQQCRYSYYPDSRVLEVAHELRKRRIPADGIWMDIDYMQHYKIFTFDSTSFPNPKKLNDSLHALLFKSVYMIDPGVKKEPGYSVYDSGSRKSLWVADSTGNIFTGKVWPGACVFPDFTYPETQNWWKALYPPFMRQGIDGVWNDMNEPSVFDGPGGTMPVSNVHRGGGVLPEGNHLRYHNVYGMLMVRASRDGVLAFNPDKRPFVLSRANFLGGQRYAATWTGDNISSWNYLKIATPMVLNLGLSGQPFSGPDIGGFGGSATPELFSSWISIGAFYPFCRNHSAKHSAPQEPWMFGEHVEDISRRALTLRYRLLPYLYTLFWQASKSGLPIMRPAFFADFKDTSLRKEESAFLFGDDLLIVPHWSKNPSLPKGVWRNFNIDGYRLEGDTCQPLIRIRGGSIIPATASVIQNTASLHTDSLTLFVCLDGKRRASGQVYLDGGEGFKYKRGQYELLQFNVLERRGVLKVNSKHIKGKNRNKARYFKIALISDNKTIYSSWRKGDHLSLSLNRF